MEVGAYVCGYSVALFFFFSFCFMLLEMTVLLTFTAHNQRRNATIRGPRHFLRSGPLPFDLK